MWWTCSSIPKRIYWRIVSKSNTIHGNTSDGACNPLWVFLDTVNPSQQNLSWNKFEYWFCRPIQLSYVFSLIIDSRGMKCSWILICGLVEFLLKIFDSTMTRKTTTGGNDRQWIYFKQFLHEARRVDEEIETFPWFGSSNCQLRCKRTAERWQVVGNIHTEFYIALKPPVWYTPIWICCTGGPGVFSIQSAEVRLAVSGRQRLLTLELLMLALSLEYIPSLAWGSSARVKRFLQKA